MKGQGAKHPPPIPKFLVPCFCLIFGSTNFSEIDLSENFLGNPIFQTPQFENCRAPPLIYYVETERLSTDLIDRAKWANELNTLLNILKYVYVTV